LVQQAVDFVGQPNPGKRKRFQSLNLGMDVHPLLPKLKRDVWLTLSQPVAPGTGEDQRIQGLTGTESSIIAPPPHFCDEQPDFRRGRKIHLRVKTSYAIPALDELTFDPAALLVVFGHLAKLDPREFLVERRGHYVIAQPSLQNQRQLPEVASLDREEPAFVPMKESIRESILSIKIDLAGAVLRSIPKFEKIAHLMLELTPRDLLELRTMCECLSQDALKGPFLLVNELKARVHPRNIFPL
jgi:hypothetical protein